MSTDGFDIKLLSQKTGLGEGTITSLLSRNSDLRGRPYSVKAGRDRVFFPPVMEWLKRHFGCEPAKPAKPTGLAGLAGLPTQLKLSGSQLREYRLMAQHKLITKEQLQQMIGLSPAGHTQPRKPAVPMLSGSVSKEDAVVLKILQNTHAKLARKKEDSEKQGKLFGCGQYRPKGRAE